MIHIITNRNRSLYEVELKSMFKLRKTRLVDELGWKLRTVEDGERDDYDDEETVYFLALDAEGQIEVCMRGRRTTDKCMLADVFPHLLAADWPDVTGADVFEISRYVVDPRYQGRRGGRTAQVFLASVEYGFAAGFDRLVGLVDVHVWPTLEAMPWRAQMTGLPRPYAEGVAVGVEMRCEAQDVISFQERLDVDGAVSMELGRPNGPAPLAVAESCRRAKARESARLAITHRRDHAA